MTAWGNAFACAINAALYAQVGLTFNLVLAIATGLVALISLVSWTWHLWDDLWR